jgi:coenzyme F420-reducing hydrogenase delta subunit
LAINIADNERKLAPEAFEPTLVAFCCNFCAYAAADLAGSMRLQYPATIRVIQLPCSGRIDASHILKAFEEGADGVYVAGCMEGECHYREGNLWAKNRAGLVKKMLDETGIGSERFDMFNLSAAMAGRFVEIAIEMTERVRLLGPNPARAGREKPTETLINSEEKP